MDNREFYHLVVQIFMKFATLTLSLLLVLLLSACGGGGGGDQAGFAALPQTGTASFGVSDAPVEDLASVTIEVDRITLKRSNGADIVIDTFNSTDLGIIDAETFQIDLLNYQGINQAIVIDEMALPAGQYTGLRLKVLDQNINHSFVYRTSDSSYRPIKVPSDELKLGGFHVTANAVQTFTIEFDLRQSMTLAVGPDEYILKPRGVRIVNNQDAATLSGSVDQALFDTVAPCDAKLDPLAGNVIYLYPGHNLVQADLADAFDPVLSATSIPAAAIEPYSSVTPVDVTTHWAYAFGFLPPGDYTLVFSCAAENDDPQNFDGLSLPVPADQVVEVTLPEGGDIVCNLPVVSGNCGS